MFTHVGIPEIPEVSTKTIDSKRFYLTPDGKAYPSITTVLSKRSKQGLMEWRKRVGEDVANHIARKAAERGTSIHSMCEDYLNNADMEKHKEKFLHWCLFQQFAEKALKKIDNIRAQEIGLWSDNYRVAGRVDCIAEFDGVLSVIDFKTSTKERTDDWNESYYIQASAYAEMYEERCGEKIDQIVILVVTEDGTVQEFVREKHDYLPLLVEAIDNFTAEWQKEVDTQETV